MINDINSWRVSDEEPGTALDRIEPISKRAACLIARNKTNTLLSTEFLRFQGAIEMMKGLDYHHDNFMNVIKRLAEMGLDGTTQDLQMNLMHEVTAYLNRLGQFHYFLTSDFVATACPTARTLAPTLEGLTVFRMKYSAHRSIDDPRDETIHVQTTHAMAMSSIGGNLFDPKPGTVLTSLGANPSSEQITEWVRDRWTKYYLFFQLISNEPNKIKNFSIEKDHPAIMKETFTVLKNALGL